MNKRKILAIGIVLVLSISVVAFGDDHVTKVEAFLAGDLNFSVDGEAWNPKDVDGSNLTPIIYKDRTYVPVRSLLEDKGVTVGYEADTRTVLLDYSTINVVKPIDKASPLIFDTLMVEGSGGGSGKAAYKELTIKKNPNFDIQAMEMTQEMSLNLSEDTEIVVDGRMIEGSLDELLKSENSWDTESAVFTINEETNEVEKMSISTIGDETIEGAAALDIGIDIKISWPPWKVIITITIEL